MSVATAYAKALYEAARDNRASAEELVKIESELDTTVQVIESSPEAMIVLYGPVVTPNEKSAIAQALVTRLSLSKLTEQFLLLLARKDRLRMLPKIRDAFGSVRLLEEGGMPGVLVSAEPIEQKDVDGLARSFSQKLGKKVAFRVSTDANLLAGMKVTVNGVTYDGTLRSQLQQLRDRVLSAQRENTTH